MALDPARITPPRRGLLLLEGRALLELAALLPAYPFLRRAPAGDGHPVLVLPGFMASDFSTRALRGFLRERGYRAHGWTLGRNLGPSPETAAAMVDQLHRLADRYGGRVSLVGWSLGGVYARELARRFPALVRQVITLATPVP
jgi:pimeloyl-ACP methyl ester carboxylesterase